MHAFFVLKIELNSRIVPNFLYSFSERIFVLCDNDVTTQPRGSLHHFFSHETFCCLAFCQNVFRFLIRILKYNQFASHVNIAIFLLEKMKLHENEIHSNRMNSHSELLFRIIELIHHRLFEQRSYFYLSLY